MVLSQRIVVVGLGYVGLPLAVALARRHSVIGYDLDAARIGELRAGHDRTCEIDTAQLVDSTLGLTDDPLECAGADLYIVTVPTPVDNDNRPDLRALLSASHSVADWIDAARRPTIVFESTVYPGVTDDVCGPAIEAARPDLQRGRDFRLGYSPERINPGDTVHRVETITKVVAGEDQEVTDQLAGLYGSINGGNVFRAKSIKAAEAAKVIENAQRDINIAFMNEVAQIFSSMGLPMGDVLAAARTKWNFLPFEPGLVGGHCIGVDPYYLAHAAREMGHDPRVVLAGRSINDGMGEWIAGTLDARRGGKGGRALVLGLTFKENVPDLRNSRVIDIVRDLENRGYEVQVADPMADPRTAEAEYGVTLVDPSGVRDVDVLVGAVAHDLYRALDADWFLHRVTPGGVVADVKGIWRDLDLPGLDRWSL